MRAGDRVLRSNRQRYQIFREQNGLCALCDLPMGQDFHIDHKRPVIAEGKTEYQNLQATHPRCNQRKGSKYHAA